MQIREHAVSRRLEDFIDSHPNLLVITGAGCSVGSGIPTYRDDQGVWRNASPIQHQEFLRDVQVRRRYWARSYVGWPTISDAEPNKSHYALADLEAQGRIRLLVTQNVDRLHQRAGSLRVVDLHGRLDQVICLDCRAISWRDEHQLRLAEANPRLFSLDSGFEAAPDGDANVPDDLTASMHIPPCTSCGGVLKPHVVLFGDSVDRDLVATIYREVEKSAGVLVIGSSLMVFSGYRFCRHAARHRVPIACINAGQTRADDLFSLKIRGDCSEVLSSLSKLHSAA